MSDNTQPQDQTQDPAQATVTSSTVVVDNASAEVLPPEPSECALIDENGLYVGMVIIPAEADLTDRYLTQITSCDLTPGAYKWDTAAQAFVSVKNRQAAIDVALTAIQANVSALHKYDFDVPLDVLIWLKQATA